MRIRVNGREMLNADDVGVKLVDTDACAPLFSTSVGSGVPLLTLHGIGLDHTYMRPWLEPLAEHAQVIYFDQRGCGRSQRPASYAGVTHASWVEDAEALRGELGHDQVILFGHSQGACLALEYALLHPERLLGVILCAAAPALDYPEVVAANAWARGNEAQLAVVGHMLGEPMASDRELEDMWQRILPLYFHDQQSAVVESIHREVIYSAAAWNHCNSRCLANFDLCGRLHEVAVPTLIVTGESDWITPPREGGERLHAGIAGSELRVLPNCGHFPFAECPELFGAEVAAWLRSLPAT